MSKARSPVDEKKSSTPVDDKKSTKPIDLTRPGFGGSGKIDLTRPGFGGSGKGDWLKRNTSDVGRIKGGVVDSGSSNQEKEFYFRDNLVVYQGVLYKRGHINRAWKSRIFVLTADGTLHYLAAEGREITPALKVHLYECLHKGSIPICKDTIVEDGGSDGEMYLLNIVTPGHFSGRTYIIGAKNKAAQQSWLAELNSFMVQVNEIHDVKPSTRQSRPVSATASRAK